MGPRLQHSTPVLGGQVYCMLSVWCLVCNRVGSSSGTLVYTQVFVRGGDGDDLVMEGVCWSEWELGAGEAEGFAFVRPEMHLPFGLPLL